MKNHKKHIDVSRLFIYYNARRQLVRNESHVQDTGTSVSHAIDALRQYGCCKENVFPFEKQHINQRPPEHCYHEAKNYRITEALQLSTDIDEMKDCLAEGFPFVFGLETFQSFHQALHNGGCVPMPDVAQEPQNMQHGWHAMLAVGYSDTSQCFFVRNSWGENWVSMTLYLLIFMTGITDSLPYRVWTDMF